MVDDRANYQLRKKGYKDTIMKKAVNFGLSVVRIYKIGDLLKCIKRDRKRKNNLIKNNITPYQCIDIFYKKIGVFEVNQQSQVCRHAYNQGFFSLIF